MKKILYVLAAAVALFVIAGCSTGMHNGTQMYVTTVTVKGLNTYTAYSYEGKTLILNGPFNNWSAWTTAAAPNAIVSGGTATFTINAVISDPQFEFLIVPSTLDWSYKIGQTVGGSNVLLNNTWTGPVLEKTVTGTMSSDGSVQWVLQ